MQVLCDVCGGAPAAVLFCTDEAALCSACDRRVHRADKRRRIPLVQPCGDDSAAAAARPRPRLLSPAAAAASPTTSPTSARAGASTIFSWTTRRSQRHLRPATATATIRCRPWMPTSSTWWPAAGQASASAAQRWASTRPRPPLWSSRRRGA
ncbi:B-box zinc finger protein 20 [Zea mays]|uniref:B-box zinc finger protein 20 n=1 Tax=Zea mays TaxID=4577 RepID=A0A1D6LN07_MAIZE|nr:B-box zinc finger protein 20 [Zea mays]